MNGPHYLDHLARLGASDLHPFGREGSRRLSRALRVRPGQRVLEIGCGTGHTLVRVGSAHRVRLVGLDRVAAMLGMARRRLRWAGLARSVGLVRADASVGIPFADGAFDRVFMESVVGFHPPVVAEAILSEAFRVLRPGGRLAANEAVWRAGTPERVVSRIHRAGIDAFGLSQASPAAWSAREWRACMEGCGFTVLGADPLEPDTPEAPDPPSTRLGAAPALLASRALTFTGRLRGRLDPTLARERRRYRAALDDRSGDGRHIEARLFVLERPGGETGGTDDRSPEASA